jgi:hypothetical protein
VARQGSIFQQEVQLAAQGALDQRVHVERPHVTVRVQNDHRFSESLFFWDRLVLAQGGVVALFEKCEQSFFFWPQIGRKKK